MPRPAGRSQPTAASSPTARPGRRARPRRSSPVRVQPHVPVVVPYWLTGMQPTIRTRTGIPPGQSWPDAGTLRGNTTADGVYGRAEHNQKTVSSVPISLSPPSVKTAGRTGALNRQRVGVAVA